MEHIYKIKLEEFANIICDSVFEHLSKFAMSDSATSDETRVVVITKDAKTESEG